MPATLASMPEENRTVILTLNATLFLGLHLMLPWQIYRAEKGNQNLDMLLDILPNQDNAFRRQVKISKQTRKWRNSITPYVVWKTATFLKYSTEGEGGRIHPVNTLRVLRWQVLQIGGHYSSWNSVVMFTICKNAYIFITRKMPGMLGKYASLYLENMLGIPVKQRERRRSSGYADTIFHAMSSNQATVQCI
ncbi:unnamed protein product [Urochloa humidicola]